METPKFNNQPKLDLEKIPQENEGSSIAKEQESGKKENITLEIDGHKMEAMKYYFEYPERIQKETGILGYERTVILPESLFSLVRDQAQKSLGFSLDEIGIHNSSELLLFLDRKIESFSKEELSILMSLNLKVKDVTWYEYTPEQLKLSTIQLNLESNFNEFINAKVLPVISNGEYPNRSYTHTYALYNHDAETRSRYNNYFKENFFLGKIYDLEKIKEEKKHKTYPFSSAHTATGDYSRDHANITLYNQEDPNKKVSVDHKIPLGDILKYEDDIRQGKTYATTEFGGLNLTGGGFTYGDDAHPINPDIKKNICFGFSFKQDNFMKEYFEKVFSIYAKQNEAHGEKMNKIVHAAIFLLLNNVGDINIATWKNMKKDDIDFLDTILETNIHRKLSAREIEAIYEKYTCLIGDISHKQMGYVDLPVFIGHKELPQLSWGHATYANYTSEKGFNFFKFKHADHLPIKEGLKSFES